MYCPECDARMKCMDTACVDNTTVRNYVCKSCNIHIYTKEEPCDKNYALRLLKQKKDFYSAIKKSVNKYCN